MGNVLSALAPSFLPLAAGRIIAALAPLALMPLFFGIAADIVPPERRGSRVGRVSLGFSLAMIAGLPIGAALGQWLSWRATFWAVALLTLAVTVPVAALAPDTPGISEEDDRGRLGEVRVLGDRRVQIVTGVTALAAAASFTAYTYVTPLLTDSVGFDESTVTVLLLLFGIGGTVGNLVGGRLTDRSVLGAVSVSVAALGVSLLLLGATASLKVPVVFLFRFGAAYYAHLGGEHPAAQRGLAAGPHPRADRAELGVQPGHRVRRLARRPGHRRRGRASPAAGGGRDRRGGGPVLAVGEQAGERRRTSTATPEPCPAVPGTGPAIPAPPCPSASAHQSPADAPSPRRPPARRVAPTRPPRRSASDGRVRRPRFLRSGLRTPRRRPVPDRSPHAHRRTRPGHRHHHPGVALLRGTRPAAPRNVVQRVPEGLDLGRWWRHRFLLRRGSQPRTCCCSATAGDEVIGDHRRHDPAAKIKVFEQRLL
ncbi:sugar efflux transporter [Streptomyces fumanus]